MKTSNVVRRLNELQRFGNEARAMRDDPMTLHDGARNRRERRQALRDSKRGVVTLRPLRRKSA